MSQPDQQAFDSQVEGCDGRWPSPPDWFSYSSFVELEACPRRWMLRRATYPSVWKRSGYPDLPFVASLLGDIVHGALERILLALVDAGVSNAQSASAADVLKGLGGYTAILTALLEDKLVELDGNPRVEHRRDAIGRSLRERLPEMRERVQATLARTAIADGPKRVAREGEARSPLGDGSYPEADLRSTELRWAGRTDLLTIRGAEIQIVDYKTGTADPHHADQLRIYALLWARDVERNPTGHLATDLLLSYPNSDVSVPAPNVEELATLEGELAERTSLAIDAASRRPPPALPSPEVCAHCSVRHLCEEYWQFIDRPPPVSSESPMLLDVDVILTKRNGPRSWMCTVEHPRSLNFSKVVLRTAEGADFTAGEHLRVLTALADRDDEHDLLALTLTAAAEVFRMKTL